MRKTRPRQRQFVVYILQMKSRNNLTAPKMASYVLAALALLTVLKAGLLVALFSGLLVYSLVHLMAPTIARKFSNQQSRTIAVVLLSALVIVSLSLGAWALQVFLRSDASNLQTLLQKLADMIEASRAQLPEWLGANLPEGAQALRQWLTDWLREHAGEAKVVGQQAGHVIIHLLLGMIIGAMVALQDVTTLGSQRPFAAALRERVGNLALMFRKIVFAQVLISLIVLPLAGVHLPLVKTMIAVTFFAGLIPVVGNIVSNSLIVVVGLSHSLHVAVGSLVFMVVIHKLEYFLNARIIGAQINAKSWEMLTAILLMETLFGLPGVVAAPVYYAYLKKELGDQGLV
jgi:predicted PurR-regulated permease PerM